MQLNGQLLLVEMAVRALDDPRVTPFQAALQLGALREDVAFLPGLDVVVEHLSLSHFAGESPGGLLPYLWPGPQEKARRYVAQARALHQQGRQVGAYVALGKACHLLTDMACPTHAGRVMHTTDPFEWYVDAHADALGALPVPFVPDAPPEVLVDELARYTRAFEPDRTHHAWGALLRRAGRRRALRRDEVAAQAQELIPYAAGHLTALLRGFVRGLA
jgi:hypothetical protein